MVHAHRVVGGDGPVEKGPLGLAAILLAQLVEGRDLLPELEDGPFLSRKIDLRVYLVERHEHPQKRRRNYYHSKRPLSVVCGALFRNNNGPRTTDDGQEIISCPSANV